MSRALVLGGGGVAGIGWEIGVLHGLAECGVDVLAADVVIGTSAGSTVGAQVCSGVPLAELFDRQESGAAVAAELAVDFDPDQMMRDLVPLLSSASPGRETWGAIGRYALSAHTVTEPERRRVIEARLPTREWPAADLRITAVVADTGEDVVFTAAAGVTLLDAVAASCAVPGVWPPVTIGGVRYVDGGVRSSTNVDLAAGHDGVLVLAPVPDWSPRPEEITGVVAAMQRSGSMLVIEPDDGSRNAIGPNPLDPSTAAAAATAGRVQGRTCVDAAREVWW